MENKNKFLYFLALAEEITALYRSEYKGVYTMTGGGGGGQSAPASTTQTQALDPFLQAAYKDVYDKARAVTSMQMPVYQGQRLANFSAPEKQAQALAVSNVGSYTPTMDAGINNVAAAANPNLNMDLVNQYMDPYQSKVADEYARLGNKNFTENLMPAINSQFTGNGMFGSSNNAKELGKAAENVQQNISGQQSTLLSNGFNNAVTNANTSLARQGGLGQALSAQALQGQNAQANDISALNAAGGAQRNLQQTALDTAYNQFNQQAAYPQEQVSYLSAIAHGFQPQQTKLEQNYSNQGNALQNAISTIGTTGKALGAFAKGGSISSDKGADYSGMIDELLKALGSANPNVVAPKYYANGTGPEGVVGDDISSPSDIEYLLNLMGNKSATAAPDPITERMRTAESGNDLLAISPKGAMGSMQVMPATARDPGYGVRPASDNSPQELERVGFDYAKALRNDYTKNYGEDAGNILATAAYNAGPGTINKIIAATGSSPGDVIARAPVETQDYVSKVLGLPPKRDNVRTEMTSIEPTAYNQESPEPSTPGRAAEARSKSSVDDLIQQMMSNVKPPKTDKELMSDRIANMMIAFGQSKGTNLGAQLRDAGAAGAQTAIQQEADAQKNSQAALEKALDVKKWQGQQQMLRDIANSKIEATSNQKFVPITLSDGRKGLINVNTREVISPADTNTSGVPNTNLNLGDVSKVTNIPLEPDYSNANAKGTNKLSQDNIGVIGALTKFHNDSSNFMNLLNSIPDNEKLDPSTLWTKYGNLFKQRAGLEDENGLRQKLEEANKYSRTLASQMGTLSGLNKGVISGAKLNMEKDMFPNIDQMNVESAKKLLQENIDNSNIISGAIQLQNKLAGAHTNVSNIADAAMDYVDKSNKLGHAIPVDDYLSGRHLDPDYATPTPSPATPPTKPSGQGNENNTAPAIKFLGFKK